MIKCQLTNRRHIIIAAAIVATGWILTGWICYSVGHDAGCKTACRDPTAAPIIDTPAAVIEEPPSKHAVDPEEPLKKLGPLHDVYGVYLLADELQTQFFWTSFAWTNGPANWDYMTREERVQATFNGGFVRMQYNRNTVRIKEMYYDPDNISIRWQEELRNGQWVRHGPEVCYDRDGGYEILFRIDGELEGKRTWYAADGSIESQEWYEAGVRVKQTE